MTLRPCLWPTVCAGSRPSPSAPLHSTTLQATASTPVHLCPSGTRWVALLRFCISFMRIRIQNYLFTGTCKIGTVILSFFIRYLGLSLINSLKLYHFNSPSPTQSHCVVCCTLNPIFFSPLLAIILSYIIHKPPKIYSRGAYFVLHHVVCRVCRYSLLLSS